MSTQRTSIAYLNSMHQHQSVDEAHQALSASLNHSHSHSYSHANDAGNASAQDAVSTADSTKAGSSVGEKEKRKKRKTIRACNHCQKSHLTCDDSRPCARCVKKGIGATCVDGVRKKAKYLLEAEELAEASGPNSASAAASQPKSVDVPSANASTIDAVAAKPEPLLPEQQQQQQLQRLQPIPQMPSSFTSQPTSAVSLSDAIPVGSPGPPPLTSLPPTSLAATALQSTPTTIGFGSEAINLEYAILSSMLSYPMFANPTLSSSAEGTEVAAMHPPSSSVHGVVSGQMQIDQQNAAAGIPPVGHGHGMQANGTVSIPNALWAAPLPHPSQDQSALPLAAQATGDAMSASSSASQQTSGSSLEKIVGASVAAGGQPMPQRQGAWQRQSFMHDHPQGTAQQRHNLYQPLTSTVIKTSPPPHAQILADDSQHPLSRPPTSGPAVYGLNPVYSQTPAEVYSSVSEPYKYYNGFHYFFRHIRGRMDKRDIIRVSRAIAHFRPSLVALLRNLTRDDLIFMEKSFQRALMEYEKLIGFTGTPTVVWRRSGEIALVGKEFSILTQWDKSALVDGKKLIFELMDSESLVVYWEQFAVHAFENSEHSVMSECRLVRPDGATVPCAFSFTIKRDLFGIPMAIIGNFLPIL